MQYLPAVIRRWYARHKRSHSGTVRYAFPAILAFASVLSFALVISSGTSYVRIETSPQEVRAGEQVIISVYASAHIPTNAVDIKVMYPESQLTIDSVDVGESIITIWTEEPYAKDGHIYLRGGVFRKGFVGEHLVARIKAHAVSTGSARILASESVFLAGDGKGSVVAVTNNGSEIATVSINEKGTLESKVTIGLVTDIDGDGDVDMGDVRNFLTAWRSETRSFDFNGDGKMTFNDFGILLAKAFFD